jgi:hypothetical protein
VLRWAGVKKQGSRTILTTRRFNMPKSNIGRMTLALPLMLGVASAFGGYQLVRDWAAEGAALVVVGAVLLLGGATMLASAVWLLVSLGQQRLPLWSGGIASLLSGGVLAAATISNVLLCSGPT